ncbi:MAG: glutathione S-transferase N-terminal domain-containing protein, partial [Betaproteobacteria bacterium]
MLVIWGRDNSVNVQKVLWVCEEMGLPYERIDAGLNFGVVNTPRYREINPNGLVPTIDDDGFVIWESNTIVRYLAAKHARGTLWPEDDQARARAEQWMDWSNTVFWPAIRPLFLGLVRTEPAKRDPQAMEQHRMATAKVVETLELHLGKSAYLGGESF